MFHALTNQKSELYWKLLVFGPQKNFNRRLKKRH